MIDPDDRSSLYSMDILGAVAAAKVVRLPLFGGTALVGLRPEPVPVSAIRQPSTGAGGSK